MEEQLILNTSKRLGNENTTKLIKELKLNSDKYSILSKEQELELITKYKDNPDKLKEELISHNVKLVFNIAKKYFKRTHNFDDMVARGMEGLSIAASRFDPEQNIKFSTYAYNWILKYTIQEFYYKDINLDQQDISMDQIISKDHENDLSGNTALENLIATQVDQGTYAPSVKSINSDLSSIECSSIVSDIYSYIEENSPKLFESNDLNIFNRIFAERESVRQVSEDLNLTAQYINKRKGKIIENIKSMLKDKYKINSLDDILIPDEI